MTRAGDENPTEADAKPASNQASAGTGVEVAASYVEDRQKRSLAGEPSTSEEVMVWPTSTLVSWAAFLLRLCYNVLGSLCPRDMSLAFMPAQFMPWPLKCGWLVQARRHVDDAHLNANVTQLDLKNMAVSPRGERATSPSERTNHVVSLSLYIALVVRKAKDILCTCHPSVIVINRLLV